MFETDAPLRSYKDIFNKRADAYHQAMLNWPEARNEEFLAALKGLKMTPGMQVVDIPSGGGYLAHYLPDDVQLTHLETSELFRELGYSGSRFPLHLCSIDALPLENASTDIAISLAGLHHTEDNKPLFSELFRILRKGGTCMLADAGEDSPTAQFLDGWLSDHNSMGHEGWYFNRATEQSLRDAGFVDVRRETRRYHWIYSDEAEAGKYCKLMFGVDLATAEEVTQALKSHLGFETLSDGQTGLCWELDFITATKP